MGHIKTRTATGLHHFIACHGTRRESRSTVSSCQSEMPGRKMERKTILILEAIIFCCILLTPAKCGVPVTKPVNTDFDYEPDTEQITVPHRFGRIVNGKEVTPHVWRWQVFVLCGGCKFQCGGSLIGLQWVLTAAHCAEDVVPNVDKVYLGAHRVNVTEVSQQRISISRAYLHPKYDGIVEKGYDVGLLKLKNSAKLNSYVSILSLVDKVWRLPTGPNCFVTGWGVTETGKTSAVLRSASVPIWTTSNPGDCERSFPEVKTTTNFCAGGEGKGAFKGDSGGPLSCYINHRWTQVGVVSYGKGEWQAGVPSVYANVSAMRDFIDNTMASCPISSTMRSTKNGCLQIDSTENSCLYNKISWIYVWFALHAILASGNFVDQILDD